MCNPKARNTLYNCPVFSSGLLKSFDRLQQQFVFDLLINALPIARIKNTKDKVSILKLLKDTSLIQKQETNIHINTNFRKSLLKGFCNLDNILYLEKTDESFGCDPVLYDNILYMIVNKNLSAKNITLKNILLFGEIIDTNVDITNKGFEFLLKTRNEQIWILLFVIIKYLSLKNSRDEEYEASLVRLIFEISHKNFDCFYKITNDDYLEFVSMMAEIGLVCCSRNVLLINDLFKTLFVESNSVENRFLYIESNFKIYAYTESKFELCILDMFCAPVAVLPNMIAYRLTEESATAAFTKKITSKQIVHYLVSKSKEHSSNVLEMIEIWECKKKRVMRQSGVLLHNFMSLVDFNRVVNFAKSRKYLIEHFENKRMLVVKEEGIEEIKECIKQL